MSVTETKIATCDTCKQDTEFAGSGKLPAGWERVLLRRRNGDGQELHFLDLCLGCQEKALKALGRPK